MSRVGNERGAGDRFIVKKKPLKVSYVRGNENCKEKRCGKQNWPAKTGRMENCMFLSNSNEGDFNGKRGNRKN